MKAIVVYCRSACEPQPGPSTVLAQARELRRHAKRITHVYIDVGVSGLTLERPGLQQLIADCRAGKIGTVIAQDAARLSRDAGQLLTLLQMFQDAGVRVEFAGGDPVLACRRSWKLSFSGVKLT
jgi:DNA invertase Pin-like site-specific DNA recombinase